MERALVLEADEHNPDVGDLYLRLGRTTVLTTDLGQEVAQRIRVRLNFWRGEWFLNLLVGMPYIGVLFEKAVPDRVIRSIYGQVITGTEGVSSLEKLTYTIDGTRKMTLTFEARLKDGTVFKSSSYGPFVVGS